MGIMEVVPVLDGIVAAGSKDSTTTDNALAITSTWSGMGFLSKATGSTPKDTGSVSTGASFVK